MNSPNPIRCSHNLGVPRASAREQYRRRQPLGEARRAERYYSKTGCIERRHSHSHDAADATAKASSIRCLPLFVPQRHQQLAVRRRNFLAIRCSTSLAHKTTLPSESCTASILPGEVLKKLYFQNALKITPGRHVRSPTGSKSSRQVGTCKNRNRKKGGPRVPP